MATWMRKNPKRIKAEVLRWTYMLWKRQAFEGGFFPVFNGFKQAHLKDISGNALKLYVYLGLHGRNETGESFHSIDTIAKFFNATPRAIKSWMKELVDRGLVERIQLKRNSSAITYLKPYELGPLKSEESQTEEDASEGLEELMPLLTQAQGLDDPDVQKRVQETLSSLGAKLDPPTSNPDDPSQSPPSGSTD